MCILLTCTHQIEMERQRLRNEYDTMTAKMKEVDVCLMACTDPLLVDVYVDMCVLGWGLV